jgi:hypothetical protein
MATTPSKGLKIISFSGQNFFRKLTFFSRYIFKTDVLYVMWAPEKLMFSIQNKPKVCPMQGKANVFSLKKTN